MKFTATCPRGLEDLLVAELQQLELNIIGQTRAAVHFDSDIEGALRACLWLRVANRVLLPLATFSAPDPDALYNGAGVIDWSSHFSHHSSFAIDSNVAASKITHSHFAGLKVKDAIVDHFRDETGERPDINTDLPDIRINLHLYKDQATISLDLGGHSLHQRGYRARMVDAPLKENVAAAMLLRMRWPQIAAQGGSFIDPFCGSGTLMIEAAMMAGDVAPGLLREHWGFLAWQRVKPETWQTLTEQALDRAEAGLEKLPLITGGDNNADCVAATKANIRAAGLSWKVLVSERDADDWTPPEDSQPGLILSNPPYGERLGSNPELTPLYLNFGGQIQQHFAGWQLGVLTSDSGLARSTGLRANKHWAIDNGPIACRLYRFEVGEGSQTEAAPTDLVNRLRKNHKRLARWAQRSGRENYRLYDADLPEYASAIDLYQTHGDAPQQFAVIQEYAPPASIPASKAQQRLRQTLQAVCEVLSLNPQQVRLKTRQRQRGSEQYQKQNDREQFYVVVEQGVKLLINVDDYLDTGLFLDHAPIRQRLQQESQGKSLLNLFCYTASATAHAAVGGAKQTTSVDLSKSYLAWAERNLTLNGFLPGENHQFLRADVTDWLKKQAPKPKRWDIIFCDPPSFSNSKRMDDDFDVQRDHAELIRDCATLLAPGGLLIFSCNRRGFSLDKPLHNDFAITDITADTLAEDFKTKNGKPIHCCFEIRASA